LDVYSDSIANYYRKNKKAIIITQTATKILNWVSCC